MEIRLKNSDADSRMRWRSARPLLWVIYSLFSGASNTYHQMTHLLVNELVAHVVIHNDEISILRLGSLIIKFDRGALALAHFYQWTNLDPCNINMKIEKKPVLTLIHFFALYSKDTRTGQ